MLISTPFAKIDMPDSPEIGLEQAPHPPTRTAIDRCIPGQGEKNQVLESLIEVIARQTRELDALGANIPARELRVIVRSGDSHKHLLAEIDAKINPKIDPSTAVSPIGPDTYVDEYISRASTLIKPVAGHDGDQDTPREGGIFRKMPSKEFDALMSRIRRELSTAPAWEVYNVRLSPQTRGQTYMGRRVDEHIGELIKRCNSEAYFEIIDGYVDEVTISKQYNLKKLAEQAQSAEVFKPLPHDDSVKFDAAIGMDIANSLKDTGYTMFYGRDIPGEMWLIKRLPHEDQGKPTMGRKLTHQESQAFLNLAELKAAALKLNSHRYPLPELVIKNFLLKPFIYAPNPNWEQGGLFLLTQKSHPANSTIACIRLLPKKQGEDGQIGHDMAEWDQASNAVAVVDKPTGKYFFHASRAPTPLANFQVFVPA